MSSFWFSNANHRRDKFKRVISVRFQCNNPQTKEAKLSAAMRIVPEWREYDAELKALQARVRRGLYQAADHEQVITPCYMANSDL